VAITPDQAPVTSFTVSAGKAGSASSFDASSSTVRYGSITSYAWNFGDGHALTTTSPTATHTYASAGAYTATLTETDSAGTSSSQVFTGQTVSRNGGAGATAIRNLSVSAAPPPSQAPGAAGGPSSPARVVISARTLTVTARGDVLIPISCPADAPGGCHGTITIRLTQPRARRAQAFAARCARGCRSLGSTSYQAGAGKTKRVRVHMASYGRKLLAQRKRLRVSVTVTNVSGSLTATTTFSVTLRAHAPHA
jgi:hypothetical protein